VRAVSGREGREACFGASGTSGFFGVMGSVVISSAMLESVPLGSSDFWRLARVGAARCDAVCCSSSSSKALRFLESSFVCAGAETVDF
jgi:hypothetical protein